MAEIKKIVRIAKVDLKGDKKLCIALTKIKGVSFMLNNAIINALKLNPDEQLGALSEVQLNKIKNVLENPSKYGIPSWLYNRRKDLMTGEDKHLIGVNIGLQVREDIKRMQATRSYRGFRHGVGLKVRGQRTRAHPRKGRALGVKRRKGKKGN